MTDAESREANEQNLREQVQKAQTDYEHASGPQKAEARLKLRAALKALSTAVLK
jgi:hypothetical protein